MSRLLGIDYGTVRIGLSLSDPIGILATPLPFLDNNSPSQVISAMIALIETHQITGLVVGMPRNMDGTYGPSAQKVRDLSPKYRNPFLFLSSLLMSDSPPPKPLNSSLV